MESTNVDPEKGHVPHPAGKSPEVAFEIGSSNVVTKPIESKPLFNVFILCGWDKEKSRPGWLNYILSYKKAIQSLFIVSIFYVIQTIILVYWWEFTVVDSVYFVTASITTVGYGDKSPQNDGERMYTIFFLLFGLIVIFQIINDFATYLLEMFEDYADGDASVPANVKRISKCVFSVSLIVGCVLLGGLGIHILEGLTYLNGFYWATVTTLTVGYGDVSITHDGSKIFTIFYMLISTMSVGNAIGNFGEVFAEIREENKRQDLMYHLNPSKLLDKFSKLDAFSDDASKIKITKLEFVIFMINECLDIPEKDITPFLEKFENLDYDKSGYLDKNDIDGFSARMEKRKASIKPPEKITIYSGFSEWSMRLYASILCKKYSQVGATEEGPHGTPRFEEDLLYDKTGIFSHKNEEKS